VPANYEIRVAGPLDETAEQALAGLDVSASGAVTMITGDFDQAALYGLFELIRALRLDLIDARRVRGLPPACHADRA
jgi:hypothetical protein